MIIIFIYCILLAFRSLKKKLSQKIRMIDNFIYLVLLMGLSEMRFKVIGLTLEPELGENLRSPIRMLSLFVIRFIYSPSLEIFISMLAELRRSGWG
jgi:hypothetical protein